MAGVMADSLAMVRCCFCKQQYPLHANSPESQVGTSVAIMHPVEGNGCTLGEGFLRIFSSFIEIQTDFVVHKRVPWSYQPGCVGMLESQRACLIPTFLA